MQNCRLALETDNNVFREILLMMHTTFFDAQKYAFYVKTDIEIDPDGCGFLACIVNIFLSLVRMNWGVRWEPVLTAM